MLNIIEIGDLIDGYEYGGELFKCFVVLFVYDVLL